MSDTSFSPAAVRFRGWPHPTRVTFVSHSARVSCGRQCTGNSSEVKCLYKANFLSRGNFFAQVPSEVCVSEEPVEW